MRASCLAFAFVLLAAGTVGASTLTEGAGSAEFSGDWKSPTLVGAGPDRIAGRWSGGNDHDLLGFTGLRKGAQTVTLRFSPLAPIGATDWSFSTGGSLRYQFEAPRYGAWEGREFGSVNMQHWNRNGDFTYLLQLGDDFMGVLYLGLYGTHGSLNYNIGLPGNAMADQDVQPAPVPLPMGGALLPAGLAALALLRRRRSR